MTIIRGVVWWLGGVVWWLGGVVWWLGPGNQEQQDSVVVQGTPPRNVEQQQPPGKGAGGDTHGVHSPDPPR